MLDKDGLIDITNKRVEIIKLPLQIVFDGEEAYDLEREEYINGIDSILYDFLLKIRKKKYCED